MGVTAETPTTMVVTDEMTKSIESCPPKEQEEVQKSLDRVVEAVNVINWALESNEEVKHLASDLSRWKNKLKATTDKAKRRKLLTRINAHRNSLGSVLTGCVARLGATVILTGGSLMVTYGCMSTLLTCALTESAMAIIATVSVVSGIAAVLGVIGIVTLTVTGTVTLVQMLRT